VCVYVGYASRGVGANEIGDRSYTFLTGEQFNSPLTFRRVHVII